MINEINANILLIIGFSICHAYVQFVQIPVQNSKGQIANNIQ